MTIILLTQRRKAFKTLHAALDFIENAKDSIYWAEKQGRDLPSISTDLWDGLCEAQDEIRDAITIIQENR